VHGVENAGVENAGEPVCNGVENAGVENAGEPVCNGVENAGVENVAPDCRGAKRGSNEYGKPKFPLFNLVTSGLQQPIELM